MKVWVLTISHRHGSNVSAHVSLASAKRAVVQYVKEEWINEMPDDASMPDDDNELINAYFDTIESEFADIDECELES